MFTDRFIKVPIKLYDVKAKELTNEEISEDSFMKLNPFEISRYHPSNDDAFEDTEWSVTRVIMKDGESVMVYLPILQFEQLLNQSTF